MNDERNYREASRQELRASGTVALDADDIKLGALLRIADACEKMCIDRERLERELRRASDYARDLAHLRNAQRRSISALRGQITKLKRKLEVKEAKP